jgi:hypothetical protein
MYLHYQSTRGQGSFFMQSDTTHIVNLEVTVPRIVFATGKGHEAHAPDDDEEQVHLRPVGTQQQLSTGEISAHMIHAIRFRLFRTQLPALGRPLLFQVLRRWHKPVDGNLVRRDKRLYVSDTVTFSVEFLPQSDTSEKASLQATRQAIHPGLNYIIIYLNDEGTPSSYTIDGA